ncbi:hypothetical protein NXC14_PC00647 (plasmid) [Rhizobium sp. NXC14]|nr:hypothetical protein NXC14_PC00647 [Rhizobium sp. NXC14]
MKSPATAAVMITSTFLCISMTFARRRRSASSLDGAGYPADFVTPVGEWDVGIEIAFC